MSDEPRFELRNRRTLDRVKEPVPEDDATARVEEPEPDEPGLVEPDEDAPEPVTSSGSTGSTGRSGVGREAWAVLAVGVVAVVLAFLYWRDADGDPDRERALMRDAAMIEGTAAVETMNTMDYRDVDAGLEAWQDVSTGVLRDQQAATTAADRQILADAHKIAVGRVVQAALTELTDRTATLIAATEVTVDNDDGTEPTVKRNRYVADLVLVDGAWKLENLQQVAVGT